MDFGKLDLRRASEQGSWVHLKYDDKPLYADDGKKKKPSRVRCRGMAAEAVMQAFRTMERIEINRGHQMSKVNDVDAVLKQFQTDIIAARDALIVAAVYEWENIDYDGKPFECKPENVLTICGSGTVFFEQVIDSINEQKRLFTAAATA
jgi:hypothetical protein